LLSKNVKVKVYRTLILSVVFYGCEASSLIFREEHRLRFLEHRLLMKIFGSKKEEVTGELRRLRKEVLCDQHTSPNIGRVIKSRKMRWARHLACMRNRKGAYCVLVGRPEERPPP
jgi:hypothetical protein